MRWPAAGVDRGWGSVSILALFLFLFAAPAAAAEFTILTPLADSVVYAREPETHLVVKVANAGDLARLHIEGGTEVRQLGRWQHDESYYVHFALGLKPGRNSFTVAPFNQRIKFSYRPLRTLINIDFAPPAVYRFHRNQKMPAECGHCHTDQLPADSAIDPKRLRQMYGDFSFSPECYSCHKKLANGSAWQHSPAANLLCKTCHEEQANPGRVIIPGGKPAELCFECHVYARNWNTMGHMHGPTGTGDCTICHNPHGDKYQYQLWAEGQAELCVACHRDKQRFLVTPVSARFKPHGILQGAGCVACHSPHATETRFQLYKPINELCGGCHVKMKGLKRGHPVGGHPLSGVKDLRRPDRELACSGCHNPHGSEFMYLLIGDNLGGHVCSKCHH